MFKFTDTVTGAFCSMDATTKYVITYAVPKQMGTAETVTEVFPMSDYDGAFAAYRKALEAVLDGIKNWDDL